MTFSCPHLGEGGRCLLLKVDCVPGRKGCVLKGAVFSLPVDERIKRREEDRRREG